MVGRDERVTVTVTAFWPRLASVGCNKRRPLAEASRGPCDSAPNAYIRLCLLRPPHIDHALTYHRHLCPPYLPRLAHLDARLRGEPVQVRTLQNDYPSCMLNQMLLLQQEGEGSRRCAGIGIARRAVMMTVL